MKKLNLEIADSTIKRAHGLMDRHQLGQDDGMLFVFPYKNRQSFWMQNTYIPLDIAFVDDEGKIFEIASMSPMNTKYTRSSKPCIYAVEVNKGWFDQNNISVGDKIFDGANGIQEAKRKGHFKFSDNPYQQCRYAQMIVKDDEEEDGPQMEQRELELNPQEQQVFDETLQEEPAYTPEQQEMYEQPMQQEEVVNYNMDQTSKIKYANDHSKELDISYWTLGGNMLPPRRLRPLEGEGYPIKNGPSGQYFTGFDSSPEIQGNGWVIKGATPKNFTISNVIGLEIVQEQGGIENEQEQTIEEPQNYWDRIKRKMRSIFNR